MKNRIRIPPCLIVSIASLVCIIPACEETPTKFESSYPDVTREEKIPQSAVKMTPDTDVYPPVLHLNDWETPVPLDGPVNTAGGEDSPFIPEDRDELYFFFTPDVSIPAEKQVLDQVTGIYLSRYINGSWQSPERIWLQDPGKLALDGAEFIQGNTMLFVTAREGYTGLHWFSAIIRTGNGKTGGMRISIPITRWENCTSTVMNCTITPQKAGEKVSMISGS
jgi:hypothetical protein